MLAYIIAVVFPVGFSGQQIVRQFLTKRMSLKTTAALQLQLWSADERAQSPALRRPTPGSVAEGKVRGGQPVGVWPGEKVRGGVGAWPRLAQVA